MAKSYLPPVVELLFVVLTSVILPVIVLTFFASERLVNLIGSSCVGMVLLISAFSLIDFITAIVFSLKRTDVSIDPEAQPLVKKTKDIEFSIIVPAYLPNEKSVIKDTLNALLNEIEYEKPFQVVLVYNMKKEDETKELQTLEDELQFMQDQTVNGRTLTVLCCPKSRSKAENVNYALPACTGNVVAILDADHRPLPNVLSEVENLWQPDIAAVQGACIVRNRETNLLTRFISIEQELVFNVHHQGGSKWRDFAVFGGSNGYWDKEALTVLLMDKSALTEDIDASMRALRHGFRIQFERSVVSTELVPETLSALWVQRLRWAQGWFQCSYRHVYPLLVRKNTSVRQKVGVMVLLVLREAWYYVLPISTVTTLTVFLRHRLGLNHSGSGFYLVGESSATRLSFLIFTVVFSLELLIVYAYIPRRTRLPYCWIIFGILLYLPFIHFLVLVGLTAHFREVYGANEWIVTKRNDTGKLVEDDASKERPTVHAV